MDSIFFVIMAIIIVGFLFGILKTLKDGDIDKLKLLVIASYIGVIGTIVVMLNDTLSLITGIILTIFFMAIFAISAGIPFLAYRFHEILKPKPITDTNNFNKWN